ncbi:MAG: hypothetical protein LBH79_07735 [Nitrososphaerota archaeon]|nr:hypothetical protein [Nitrososphaerota archaeon]
MVTPLGNSAKADAPKRYIEHESTLLLPKSKKRRQRRIEVKQKQPKRKQKYYRKDLFSLVFRC